MRKLAASALVLAGLCSVLAGCKDKSAVENMSRADQEKAFQGNPEIGRKMGEQMRQRYGLTGGRPTGAPQQGPQRGPQGAPAGR